MANSYPLSYVSANLNKMLSEFFTEFGEKAQEKAYAVTKQVAQDFAEKLKSATPKSPNPRGYEHLADTVVVSEKGEKFAGGKGKVLYVHYTKWQIAHLLEFGWTARDGRFITRTPFVRPLFDDNKERYYRMYKEAFQ